MGKPRAALGKGDPASRLQETGQRNKEGAGSALRFPSLSAAWVGCREKDHQRTVWVIRFCPCFMPHLSGSALGLPTPPAPSCENGGACRVGGSEWASWVLPGPPSIVPATEMALASASRLSLV